MGLSLNVQVFRGGQMLAQQQFDSEVHRTIKIGRLPSAQLKLDDPKVSRIHAVIEFSGAEVSLIDMGSTGGTAVNGTKVHKVKLNHGDQVVLGDTQIVVGMGAAIMAAAPAAVATPAGPSPTLPPSAMPASAPWAQPRAAAPGAMLGMPPVMGRAPQGMPPGMVPGMAPASMAAMAPQAVASQPRFDDGGPAAEPVRRIGQDRLRSAAVESKPHPGLAPEEPMRQDNRVLEMRVYWGEVLLDVHHYDKPKRITIGESKRTDIFLSSEGLPQEAFPLVRFFDGDYVLTFTKQMEGEVELGGQVHSLQGLQGSSIARRDDDLESSYQVKLPAESRAIVHWGGATFALRFVSPPKSIANDF
ncbi:MAG: FHA domain-containing protein, partial [Myxococcota bacterium]